MWLLTCRHVASLEESYSYIAAFSCRENPSMKNICFCLFPSSFQSLHFSKVRVTSLTSGIRPAMVRQKPGGGTGPQEISNLEFDFQIHKDETAARFTQMQDSIDSFRAVVLEEFKKLAVACEKEVETTNDLQFGSIPS